MKRIDIFILVSLMILFLAGTFLIFYYFNSQETKCVANPLSFGAKQYEKNYGYDFSGVGYMKVPKGYKIPVVYFNSTDARLVG